MDGSLELARAAVAAGTRTILATPHINDDPSIEPARIAAGLEELRAALAEAEIPLEVLPGRGDRDLAADRPRRRDAARAGARRRPLPARREPVLARDRRLRADGARPPRSAATASCSPTRSAARPSSATPARLERLVGAGALVQVTAGSMTGGFGSTVRRFTVEHPARGPRARRRLRRPRHAPPPAGPAAPASRRSSATLPGLGEQADWLTAAGPARGARRRTAAPAAAAAAARRPAAPARAQSLTIAITELTTTSSRIRTCIQ